MNIGIIGAGFTGLTAALRLSQAGHKVTIFEALDKPGGLAIGFKAPGWQWPLEEHYHHIFTSDRAIRNLAASVKHPMEFYRPISSTYYQNTIYQLDSPLSLLHFNPLSPFDRLRVGFVLAYLRCTPMWKPLERVTARRFLQQTMGNKAYEILWEPLFVGKFDSFASQMPAAWFWARIKKRSANLGYPEGGFGSLAATMERVVKRHGGTIHFRTQVTSIKKAKKGVAVGLADGTITVFDKVICTLPTPVYVRLTKGLPNKYSQSLKPLTGIGAVNLVLALKEQFFDDNSYWLNVNDTAKPFLCLVEHTNFIDRTHYGNDHILYIGNYLNPTHRYFQQTAAQLLGEFIPHLQSINPKFTERSVKQAFIFKAPFAQPIIPLSYSQQIPPLTTPIVGLYLANMQQVYPWDRGTNYAVELGDKAAELVSMD